MPFEVVCIPSIILSAMKAKNIRAIGITHVALCIKCILRAYILLTKTTAAQNEVALSYHRERGLYFLAVVFVATIDIVIH